MILFWRWLRRYYPEVKITMMTFKSLLSIPSFETVHRRSQEIINARKCDGCGATYLHQIKECEKCGKITPGLPVYPELQPTMRTRRKRYRREQAYKHYYGQGKLTLEDYMIEEGD